ncbi:MAG: ABC transporter ATP-binding protein, partial [Candidatus Zixiibacteriota bacterium]
MWNKFKWLMSGYSGYKPAFVWLLLGTPLIAAIYMTQPLVLKYLFDVITYGDGTLPWMLAPLGDWIAEFGLSPIARALVIQLIFAAVILVIYNALQGTRAWMNMRLEWVYRQRAFDSTTAKGPDFFNKFRTGDLVTRMTDDVAEKLAWFACSGIFRFYEAVMIVTVGLVMMLSLNAELTLYTVGPLPILVIIFMLTSSTLDRRFDNLQARISDLNNVMESCFSGTRVVKAYNREDNWKQKFAQTIGARRKAEISTVRAWVAIESLYMYIWQFGIALVVLIGGSMAATGEITIGDFVAFTSYIFALVFPMFDIGQFVVKGRQSAVSIGRLMEVQDFPPMVTNHSGDNAPIDFQEIKFDHVDFGYNKDQRLILSEVSFSVCKGETVALVGKVGSGKSTIINLLTRVIDPVSGEITLDDRPLKSLSLDNYRDIIGYVPQEPVLFSDTIDGNVRFGVNSVTDERVAQVIKLAQLDSQMERFPNGIQTRIGTRGLTISGGEKQRVAIARALARNPKILILDDCTSALDARTEERLWSALHEVMPDMTCFVVTHRSKTLRKANMILLFEDGRVIDRGTHDDLLFRSESYRDLYSRSELEEAVEG